jgi:hypothetical protein
MTKQPYRVDMDGGFASEDPEATMDQIIEALDKLGVQIDSASVAPMDPKDVNPESPLAVHLRSSCGLGFP